MFGLNNTRGKAIGLRVKDCLFVDDFADDSITV